MELTIEKDIDLNQATKGRFSPEVYENLPKWLKDGTEAFSGLDRDVFFVSSLAALSSIFPNVRMFYDQKQIEANLYIFLVGGFGSGKGQASFSQKLCTAIHRHLRESEPPPEPDKPPPPKRLHFLPANSSKSGLIELLAANKRGLVFETESDTLNDILKQDFGGFDDILRKCYHHETASFYRRLNREFYEIERPAVSVLLTGTPGQLKKLIPGIESGLFSRFMFYHLEPETQFKNCFSTNGHSFEAHFETIGRWFLPYYKVLAGLEKPLIFKLTESQQTEFTEYFNNLKSELLDCYGETMAGIVNRYGVQFVRIAMTLTTVRHCVQNDLREAMYCNDLDFENTKKIMEVFIHHSLLVLNLLSDNLASLPQNKLDFYKGLPETFTTAQAVEVGAKMDIPERSVKRFLKNEQLFINQKFGHYAKRSK